MNNTNTLPEVKAKITWKNDDPTAAKKAAASITIGNQFQVHGLSIVEGSKGLFLSMPQRASEKNGEKKFFEVAHPTSAEMRKAINDAVMKAYNQEMGITQEAQSEELFEPEPAPIMGQMM